MSVDKNAPRKFSRQEKRAMMRKLSDPSKAPQILRNAEKLREKELQAHKERVKKKGREALLIGATILALSVALYFIFK